MVGSETAPADVIWREGICWKLCDRLFSYISVKTKRRRKKEKKHTRYGTMFSYNGTIETEGKTENYVNGKCANKCWVFFISSLLFFSILCWSLVLRTILSISIYSSICLFSARIPKKFYRMLGWNQSPMKILIQIQTNKQIKNDDKSQESRAGHSRVEKINKIKLQLKYS